MADTRTTKELRGAYITLDTSDKVLSTDSVTAAMWTVSYTHLTMPTNREV